MSAPVPPAGPDGDGPPDPEVRPGRGRRPTVPLVIAGAVVVLVVVAILVALSGSEDDGPARLSATGSTRGVPDASPVGRLGGRAALLRLRAAMRPDDDLSSVSLTGSHAIADLGTRAGGGRRLAITDVPDGEVDAKTDSGGPIDPGAPVRSLDADAPGRLFAAVLRGLGPSATPRIREISAFATPAGPSGGLEWRLELAGPTATQQWVGDLHGRHVLRASDGAPAPPEGSAGPAVRPSGVNATSLVRPGNLQRQLDAVGASPGATGGVTYVDVEPRQLVVVFRQPLGAPDAEGRERVRSRTFTVDAAGGVDVDDLVRRERRDEDAVGVPIAAVDPAAPLRALRTIGRRTGSDAAGRVRQVEFRPSGTFSGGAAGWDVEFGDGEGGLSTWQARPDGSGVRR